MGIGIYDFKLKKYSIEELEEYISNNELNTEDWLNISCHQKLTEAFIEKYNDKVSWSDISYAQILSEPFIDKYSDIVDWYHISRSQELSEAFIEKYSDSFDWWIIVVYHELSYEFLEKHLYRYSLYIYYGINKKKLLKLQKKYKDKYNIDKLERVLKR